MVGNSKAIHKRKGGKALSLKDEEEKSRIKIYFYMIRNNYINTKEYKKKIMCLRYILSYNWYILKIMFSKSKYKFLKVRIVLKGLYSAIFKRYDYKAFKNRLNS